MMRAGFAMAFVGLAAAAGAAPFPSEPVRIVIPYPISGPADVRGAQRMTRAQRAIAHHAPPPISDVLARIAAHAIRSDSRHEVVLERKPGAVTTRGAMAVLRAPADGHTLLLASDATMVLNPSFFHGVDYEPARDFVLVAPLATMPFVLMAHAAVPAGSTPELIRWLRLRPGEINYGSSGDGSTGHLAGELFRRMARVDMVHVSFSGGAAGLNGLAAGQVSLMFVALPLALPSLSSAHYRPLAISSASRFGPLPELATLGESGLPGYEVEAWYGLFARMEAPGTAVAWHRVRVLQALAEPSTRMLLQSHGLVPVAMSPERFAARIETERTRWGPVMQASRLPHRDREDGRS